MLLEPNIGIFISEFIILDKFWFGFIFVACFCLITIFFISFIYNVDNEEVKNKEEEEYNDVLDGIKKLCEADDTIKKTIKKIMEKGEVELDFLDEIINNLLEEEDIDISIIKKIIEKFVEKKKKELDFFGDSIKKLYKEVEDMRKRVNILYEEEKAYERTMEINSMMDKLTILVTCIIIIIWITWFN